MRNFSTHGHYRIFQNSMKNKIALVFIGVLLLGLGIETWRQIGRPTTEITKQAVARQKATTQASASSVPAHYDTPPSLGSLKPTLPAEGFIGPTKDA